MMKKSWITIPAMGLLALSLVTGCGSEPKETAVETKQTTAETTETAAETMAPTAETTAPIVIESENFDV